MLLSLHIANVLSYMFSDDTRRGRKGGPKMIQLAMINESEAQTIRRQTRALIAPFVRPVLTTQQVNVVLAQDEVVVEHNLVRHSLTGSVDRRLRVALTKRGTCNVVVVPLLPDGRVMLSLRYCYATAKWMLELPRLYGHDEDEGWREAAIACLAAGASLSADQFSVLGAPYIDPNWSGTSLLAILAEGCQPTGSETRNDTRLIAGTVPASVSAIDEMIVAGDIQCGPTLSALMLLKARQAQST
jgi:hypothetical protein